MAPTNSPTYYLTRYALFYTMAELWGSVVVSLLFWGFANEVTKVRTDFTYILTLTLTLTPTLTLTLFTCI